MTFCLRGALSITLTNSGLRRAIASCEVGIGAKMGRVAARRSLVSARRCPDEIGISSTVRLSGKSATGSLARSEDVLFSLNGGVSGGE